MHSGGILVADGVYAGKFKKNMLIRENLKFCLLHTGLLFRLNRRRHKKVK